MALMLLPLTIFAQGKNIFIKADDSVSPSIVRNLSNYKSLMLEKNNELLGEYPTHIVRVAGKISLDVDCDEVHDEIERVFTSKISPSQFFYNTYVFCGYDPVTELATHFSINSYFDPKNQSAREYLEQYIHEINGYSLFGVNFQIEKAQGVVVSLGFATGTKQGDFDTSMFVLRQIRKNHYFKSNAEVIMRLIGDIKQRFYSNEPNRILPFLSQWFEPSSGKVLAPLLYQSNATQLAPEIIFLMSDEPKIFVSKLHLSYANKCEKYATHRCLE